MRIVTFAVLMAIVPIANAQHRMSPEQASQFEAKLRGWAERHYPAITTAKQLPDGMLLGFLVDSNGIVRRHTAGFQTGVDGTSVPYELARLFRGYSEAAYPSHGAACFGGLRAGEPKYCVMYGEMARKP